MDDALESDEEPVGTATVLAVIAATMVGFAAVVAVLAVGVLDGGMPELPEIRDDGTDGGGIPNVDSGDLPVERSENETEATDGSDGLRGEPDNASEPA